MLNFVKRWFSIKAKSLDDFASIIKREQCRVVKGQVVKAAVGFQALTATVGNIGDFKYQIELISTTPTGRKVIFNELCEKTFGSEYGFADAPKRNMAAIKGLLTIENRIDQLKELLSPYIAETYISGPQGKFDETLLEKLHRDAEKLGVKPA